MPTSDTAERARLAEATGRAEDDLFSANPWYEWGPYLSERAWGTVREDYSESGDAWEYFPHDHARSRAYRWNEDGMAGISDIRHDLCLALALWNGNDPILKERMFGLTGPQGNHGEDVKDYWWYLEGLPSHALLKWRYHYPQAAFPYEALVHHGRGLRDPELELLDTGVFDDDRYWSVDVTYAKALADRGADADRAREPRAGRGDDPRAADALVPQHVVVGRRRGEAADRGRRHARSPSPTAASPATGSRRRPGPTATQPEALFCENESNAPRVFESDATTPYPKDGINDHVVSGAATVNPEGFGTKAALRYVVTVPAGGKAELRLKLHQPAKKTPASWAAKAFDEVVAAREADADEFYVALAPEGTDAERMRILRQSCAGLVWSKQMYPYNVRRWLDGDPGEMAPPASRRKGRNAGWRHLDSFDVLAMPDPWEYPWFAAWDLGFHCIPWAHLDPAFAKYQLVVLLREWFQHPNGALPAYEWNFDDVNPPVHVMAALRVFMIDGATDREFLERIFQKLLINFTWWLNREDADGNNVFSGGFLGLDNISPIDRSNLPEGFVLEQADGTAWMAYYALSMLVIALVLAQENERVLGHGHEVPRAVRPRCAGARAPGPLRPRGRVLLRPARVPVGRDGAGQGADDLGAAAAAPGRRHPDPGGRGRPQARQALRAAARRVRGDGRRHARHACGRSARTVACSSRSSTRSSCGTRCSRSSTRPRSCRRTGCARSRSVTRTTRTRSRACPGAWIDYEPAESTTTMFGGNSNWRGPVWMPVNYLAIRQFVLYDRFFGSDFKLEYPTGSGEQKTFAEIAQDLADRIVAIWLPDADGRRPVYGDTEKLQTDPAWKDNLTFNEYFHGDNGAGLGATHQTGWTALVADLIIDPPGSSEIPPGVRASFDNG